MGAATKDISGQRFGRLVAVTPAGVAKDKSLTWNCLCDCGAQAAVPGCNLRRGISKSCGCLARELSSSRNRKHGMDGTPEILTWRRMWRRCISPKDPSFSKYGGRGISVCQRWKAFSAFFADMGLRPSEKHSIDRIDVNGDYEPGNCRWATATQQSRNRRPYGSAVITGVRPDRRKFVASICTGTTNLYLGTFDNLFDAAAARISAENRYWTESSNFS